MVQEVAGVSCPARMPNLAPLVLCLLLLAAQVATFFSAKICRFERRKNMNGCSEQPFMLLFHMPCMPGANPDSPGRYFNFQAASTRKTLHVLRSTRNRRSRQRVLHAVRALPYHAD